MQVKTMNGTNVLSAGKKTSTTNYHLSFVRLYYKNNKAVTDKSFT